MAKNSNAPCPKPPCPKNAPKANVAGTTTALSWCKLRGMQKKAAGKK